MRLVSLDCTSDHCAMTHFLLPTFIACSLHPRLSSPTSVSHGLITALARAAGLLMAALDIAGPRFGGPGALGRWYSIVVGDAAPMAARTSWRSCGITVHLKPKTCRDWDLGGGRCRTHRRSCLHGARFKRPVDSKVPQASRNECQDIPPPRPCRKEISGGRRPQPDLTSTSGNCERICFASLRPF